SINNQRCVTQDKIIVIGIVIGGDQDAITLLKSGIGLVRLPSKRFSTNSDIMLLVVMAYNLLRLSGQESLRKDDIELCLKLINRN
ncbi:MAG: hypothetical protein JZU65_22455, partial [Chlorobium sp.]|nr:hypothetical protein [Chlorobium sp.]